MDVLVNISGSAPYYFRDTEILPRCSYVLQSPITQDEHQQLPEYVVLVKELV